MKNWADFNTILNNPVISNYYYIHNHIILALLFDTLLHKNSKHIK